MSFFDNPNWIVPTPPTGDSSKRVANTEFVAAAVAAGGGISTSVLASALATTLSSAYAGTTGFVLQTVYNETTSLIASNAAMAGNFTSAPIKTDGIQIVTATITPVSTTNKLLIRAIIPMGNSAAVNMLAALFQDTTTSALAATITGCPANLISNASIVYNMVSGTTGPTTFKINVANLSTVGSTWAVNGIPNQGGAPLQFLGGTLRATLAIQETKG